MPKAASSEKQAEWLAKIQEQQKSGLSVEAWCHQAGIRAHNFEYWKKKLLPDFSLNRSNFTQIDFKKSPDMTLECRGFRIRIAEDCHPILRKKLLLALLDSSC